jgi:DNA-binding HxlR family transcriptional regulator
MLGQPHMLAVLHAFDPSGRTPLRFRELESRLQISPKTLSQRLKTLVEVGFLTRRAYNEIPPRVEYEPTAKAGELRTVFEALEAWARRYTLTAASVVATTGKPRG